MIQKFVFAMQENISKTIIIIIRRIGRGGGKPSMPLKSMA
jgi:hypothetical protein